jgi:deoxycytidine triphosphate deaminase
MSILTGREIARCVGNGDVVIEPFDQQHCNPNSYNFHLGSKLLVYEEPKERGGIACEPWCLETQVANPTREIDIPPEAL